MVEYNIGLTDRLSYEYSNIKNDRFRLRQHSTGASPVLVCPWLVHPLPSTSLPLHHVEAPGCSLAQTMHLITPTTTYAHVAKVMLWCAMIVMQLYHECGLTRVPAPEPKIRYETLSCFALKKYVKHVSFQKTQRI